MSVAVPQHALDVDRRARRLRLAEAGEEVDRQPRRRRVVDPRHRDVVADDLAPAEPRRSGATPAVYSCRCWVIGCNVAASWAWSRNHSHGYSEVTAVVPPHGKPASDTSSRSIVGGRRHPMVVALLAAMASIQSRRPVQPARRTTVAGMGATNAGTQLIDLSHRDHRGDGDVPRVARARHRDTLVARSGRAAVRAGHDVPHRPHHDVHEHRHVSRRAVPPIRGRSRSRRPPARTGSGRSGGLSRPARHRHDRSDVR